MPRAPLLTRKIVDSIDKMLTDLPPVDYLGTAKEPGVKYLNALIKHFRNPAIVAKRQKNVARTKAHKESA